MRFISKSEEPEELAAYRDSKGATYKAFTEDQPLYQKIKQQLIDDQLGLCCYCGTSIELGIAHIEHLQDQHSHKELQLMFSNFLASCNGGTRQEHCGHAKGNQHLPVTPLQCDCAARFAYRSSGLVDAKPDYDTDADVNTTINVLSLNTARLKNQRKAALSNSGLFDDELSLADIDEYIELYDAPDDQGRLEPFAQAIVGRLRQERQILQQQQTGSGK